MDKTIEEAAEDFVANYYELEEYGGEVSDVEIDNSKECFIGGVNYIQSLPLRDRLAKAEIEKIRNTLDMYYGKWREHPNEATEAVYCAIKETLESIFGKEMFNEKRNNMEIKVGDKSTIESDQGQITSHRANIKSVSLFIHLEGVEDD